MDSSIVFGNLGIGEIALVVSAFLLLLGLHTGGGQRARVELHAELRRQHYFLPWIIAGAATGLATRGWTAPARLDVFGAALRVAGVLVLVATLGLAQPQGVRRAFTSLSMATYFLSWGTVTDLAAQWLA